jgi:hypothetical protein
MYRMYTVDNIAKKVVSMRRVVTKYSTFGFPNLSSGHESHTFMFFKGPKLGDAEKAFRAKWGIRRFGHIPPQESKPTPGLMMAEQCEKARKILETIKRHAVDGQNGSANYAMDRLIQIQKVAELAIARLCEKEPRRLP